MFSGVGSEVARVPIRTKLVLRQIKTHRGIDAGISFVAGAVAGRAGPYSSRSFVLAAAMTLTVGWYAGRRRPGSSILMLVGCYFC
jgi:hypothetical protein